MNKNDIKLVIGNKKFDNSEDILKEINNLVKDSIEKTVKEVKLFVKNSELAVPLESIKLLEQENKFFLTFDDSKLNEIDKEKLSNYAKEQLTIRQFKLAFYHCYCKYNVI